MDESSSQCECQGIKSPSPTPSRHSRECTAPVRRWHGELRVLIKIFYKSACAVHMQDNRLEWGGVGRILKQLPALKQTPRVNMKIHTMKECVSLCFHLAKVKSIRLFFTSLRMYLLPTDPYLPIYRYLRHVNSKQKTIHYCSWKTIPWMRGLCPLFGELVGFQSWYPAQHHVMEGDTYCMSMG